MTSREQFEAWFNPKKAEMQAKGVGSLNIVMSSRTAWAAWQASREAVEIELPSVTDAADWLISVDVMEYEHVISAIRAAGIKVKD